ncbi:Predicted membrane protein [Phocoenobacter uteri]|uniref:Predicted membrane protein n=1 Tax=Phocoenobacter uteri TaxID=146806 RepID=A0A379C8T9_9PAST|nr:NnrU family protein [Phocoenobacter uteri]MDG6882549.1 NnrU family protein [Phocoenobacter uteri]SUB58713.1 Predicted membrane protein [Phocoenobacter uteri]
MLLLILGLILFLGMHSIVIFAPNFREKYRSKALLTWKIGYGLVSIIGFVLIVIGYSDARLSSTVLYMSPIWLKQITMAMMIPVFVFFFAPYLPGKISNLTRHPQLMAVKLFMMAHLLANGTVVDLVLFGAFLVWAVLDLMALNRLPSHNPPNEPIKLKATKLNDIILVILGITVYIAFLTCLHTQLIGVSLI